MKWLLSLAIALVGFGAGWTTNGWRKDVQIQTLKAEQSQADADASEERNRTLVRMVDRESKRITELSAANDLALSQLKEKTREIETLRSGVASGRIGLRVNAICPPTSGGGAQAGTGTGVDPGAGAELAPSARPAYFALQQGITDTLGQLGACQRELTLRTAP